MGYSTVLLHSAVKTNHKINNYKFTVTTAIVLLCGSGPLLCYTKTSYIQGRGKKSCFIKRKEKKIKAISEQYCMHGVSFPVLRPEAGNKTDDRF